MKMRQIAFCLAIVLMVFGAAMAQAAEMVVTVDGKQVRMDRVTINHEITVTDRNKGNQSSAMACSFLIYDLLAKGDIQGAAAFSTDPAKAADKWARYRTRIGEEAFNSTMKEYFTSKNVAMAELFINEDIMLVVRTEHGALAQFYQKKDGKYLMTNDPAAGKTLGAILSMIREGKIKL